MWDLESGLGLMEWKILSKCNKLKKKQVVKRNLYFLDVLYIFPFIFDLAKDILKLFVKIVVGLSPVSSKLYVFKKSFTNIPLLK